MTAMNVSLEDKKEEENLRQSSLTLLGKLKMHIIELSFLDGPSQDSAKSLTEALDTIRNCEQLIRVEIYNSRSHVGHSQVELK